MELTKDKIKAAVYGGSILGGGGGGSLEDGLDLGMLALKYGHPELISLDELEDNDILVTVAAVGAPAAKQRYVKPDDFVKAVSLLNESLDRDIRGLITNENGGMATVNGLIQSAVLDIPVVDAPCNGRAHPISDMGGMGLHVREKYSAVQAAVGGNPSISKYHQLQIKGTVSSCSDIIRELAVKAGGIVAVARNPVNVEYVKENAALGAIRQAIRVGEKLLALSEDNVDEATNAVAEALNGEVTVKGTVNDIELVTEGGFDIGKINIEDKYNEEEYELTFWNEYMTLEKSNKRLATFPDLIMTISLETGNPITTAEISPGQKLAVIKTDLENIRLGQGMFDENLLQRAEDAIGKELIRFLKGRLL